MTPLVPLGPPPWLEIARTYEGLKEIPGRRHNPAIVRMWELIKAPFRDDETPWCAAFVGACLEEAGYQSTRSAAARSYETYRHALEIPCVGAIAVFWRGSPKSWSGHVGFVEGQDAAGNLMIRGGNQGNASNVRPFSRRRLLTCRWPGIAPHPQRFNLPVLSSDGRLSENEV